ncbi:DUF3658 domain-containing protein [Streptomyces rimosus]|uniref:DUF3658 domain-containing protein n=1 Tax=Streptomyces rimosus TaxID=1927 RepID=UPI00067AD0D7|nr:DUF3658 domain-containing protein [Streptomyces rimosus]
METLHLVPGDSAAESLRAALGADTSDDPVGPVQAYPDDLGMGPLRPDDPATRAQWWQTVLPHRRLEGIPSDGLTLTQSLTPTAFWERADAAGHLVVWFSTAAQHELAFFHAICDRLQDRPFDMVQVPGPVGARHPEEFVPLLADARPVADIERRAARAAWQRLKQENATFRVATPAGLVSAPEDHYDAALLDTAGPGGTALAVVVGTVMATMNVPDSPLYWRIAALVKSGALIADGPLVSNGEHAIRTKIKRA